jgi:hypothetical protein
MSYNYYIDPDINAVFIEHFGQMKIDDVPDSLELIRSHPLHKKGMNIYRDITLATQPPEYNFGFFKKASPARLEEFEDPLGKCKLAWITGTSHDYKVVHQFLTSRRNSTDTVERKPFSDASSAREWLGITDDYEIDFNKKGEIPKLFKTHFDIEKNCIFIQHFDLFHPDIALEQLNMMVQDPRFKSGMNILRDVSLTKLPDFLDYRWLNNNSPRRMKEIYRTMDNCRIGWLVGNAQDYGKLHRWVASQLRSASVERKPFRELADALEWLDIPPDYKINYAELS